MRIDKLFTIKPAIFEEVNRVNSDFTPGSDSSSMVIVLSLKRLSDKFADG